MLRRMREPPEPVRAAVEADVDRLSATWCEGWREAHLAIVPPVLARLRTLESFRRRLDGGGRRGACRRTGRCAARLLRAQAEELYQLYVAPEARGTGVAAALVADEEARLAAAGVWTA
jgi:ribosomal protein S18 acetylase RimI-like enzyme